MFRLAPLALFALCACGDPSVADICGPCDEPLELECEADYQDCLDADDGDCFDALEEFYAEQC